MSHVSLSFLLLSSGRIVSSQSGLLDRRLMFVVVSLFLVCLAGFLLLFLAEYRNALVCFSLCGRITLSPLNAFPAQPLYTYSRLTLEAFCMILRCVEMCLFLTYLLQLPQTNYIFLETIDCVLSKTVHNIVLLPPQVNRGQLINYVTCRNYKIMGLKSALY